MRPIIVLLALILHACSAPVPRPAPNTAVEGAAQEVALLELADNILAAARARDANRFASYFSTRPDFVYLINKRRLASHEAVRTTFHTMLSRHEAFDVHWGERTVQMLTPTSSVLTGEFRTKARRINGEEWEASGVVTFAAVRETAGWRVVNWHTTE